MNTGLKGRNVLVTGASRNMGRLAAFAFAREGAHLAICTSARMSELNQVAEEARALGVTVVAEKCDVTDGTAVARFVNQAREQLGGVDVVVNAVGYRCETTFLELDPAEWMRNIQVNLGGAFHVCRNAIPLMMQRGWGRIINISGTAAAYLGGGVAKGTVKLGLVGFTRGLAREFGAHNITANCIAPGAVQRGQTEAADRPWSLPPGQALRRPGKPDEVISLMLYLASEHAGFITGQCYPVNGGTYFQ